MHAFVLLSPEDVSGIRARLDLLELKGKQMLEALERLTREVSEQRTVTQSAITLIHGLAQQIRDLAAQVADNAAIAAQLNSLADDLDAQQNELIQAIVANTPGEPEEN